MIIKLNLSHSSSGPFLEGVIDPKYIIAAIRLEEEKEVVQLYFGNWTMFTNSKSYSEITSLMNRAGYHDAR